MSLQPADDLEYRLDLIDPHELESGGLDSAQMGEYYNAVREMGRKKNVKIDLFADIIEAHAVDDVYVFFRQFSNRFAHPDRALGIGNATMNKAVAKAFFDGDVNRAKELRSENAGSLSEGLRKAEIGTDGESQLAVDLYERQLQIERASSDGSITELIVEGLSECSEPWVFSQMVGKDIPMYCGDYIMVDAIAQVSDEYSQNEVRTAWGVTNDGPLVFLDWARDDRELTTECQPHSMIGEMKAKKTDAAEVAELDDNWIAQTKYDGARLFIHHAGDGDYRAYMAGNSDVTAHLPELFEEPIASQLPEFEFILDCEVTPYDPDTGEVLPFQHILKRTGMSVTEMVDAEQTGVEARFKLFDVLNWQGHDITDDPYEERFGLLRKTFTPDLVARTGRDIEAVYRNSLENGHEGVVLKTLDSAFEFNIRSTNWLKWKADPMEADLRISDAYEGEGRAAGGVGSLVLEAKHGGGWVCVGAVGTGFTDHDRERLWKQYQSGDLVGETVQVDFEELQVSDDGVALRFPAFQSLRPEGEPDSLDRLCDLADVEL